MSNNKSGTFKQKRNYFSQVSNTALRDKSLSLKAKGLYSLVQSYITIENFILYKDMLVKESTDGDTAFQGAWKELKEKGYLVQERTNSGKGWIYEYDLLDSPIVISPTCGKPIHGEDRVYNKTDSNNTNSIILNIINVVVSKENNRKFFNFLFDCYLTEYKNYASKEHPLLSKKYVKQIIDNIDDFADEYNIYSFDNWQKIIDMYFKSNLDCDRNMIHFAQKEILYNRASNCNLIEIGSD